MQSSSRGPSQKHCRLRGCRRWSTVRSVSSRGRCVWLTSRPSWPLEGGRPREVCRSRARYRLLGHARGPSSHHPRSYPWTRHRASSCTSEESIVYSARSRYNASSSTAEDRIMFRYLDDANARFEITESHPWRAPANRSDFAPRGIYFDYFARVANWKLGIGRGGMFHQVSDFQRSREFGNTSGTKEILNTSFFEI